MLLLRKVMVLLLGNCCPNDVVSAQCPTQFVCRHVNDTRICSISPIDLSASRYIAYGQLGARAQVDGRTKLLS